MSYEDFVRAMLGLESPDKAAPSSKDRTLTSKLEKAVTLEREAATLPCAVRNLNLPPIDGDPLLFSEHDGPSHTVHRMYESDVIEIAEYDGQGVTPQMLVDAYGGDELRHAEILIALAKQGKLIAPPEWLGRYHGGDDETS